MAGGVRSRANNIALYRAVVLQDLPALVQALLGFSVFRVGHATYRQTQGASVGSQWAPVLCSIVALHREHTYRQSLTYPLTALFLVLEFGTLCAFY